MRKLYLLLTALALCASTTAHAAPVLFNNVMAFDNHNFALVDFETGQSTYSEIDNYLATYDAQLVGGDFAHIHNTATIREATGTYYDYVSATHGIVGPGGVITVHFNTPVYAAGIFLIGMVHDASSDPYTGGLGTRIKVTYGDGTTVLYDYSALLSPVDSIYDDDVNGFFGVMDLENGITEFECFWNRDSADLDNLYFGNNVTISIDLLGGPTNLNRTYFSLPTLNGSESFEGFAGTAIPEPGTILLLGVGITGIIRKYFQYAR